MRSDIDSAPLHADVLGLMLNGVVGHEHGPGPLIRTALIPEREHPMDIKIVGATAAGNFKVEAETKEYVEDCELTMADGSVTSSLIAASKNKGRAPKRAPKKGKKPAGSYTKAECYGKKGGPPHQGNVTSKKGCRFDMWDISNFTVAWGSKVSYSADFLGRIIDVCAGGTPVATKRYLIQYSGQVDPNGYFKADNAGRNGQRAVDRKGKALKVQPGRETTGGETLMAAMKQKRTPFDAAVYNRMPIRK